MQFGRIPTICEEIYYLTHMAYSIQKHLWFSAFSEALTFASKYVGSSIV